MKKDWHFIVMRVCFFLTACGGKRKQMWKRNKRRESCICQKLDPLSKQRKKQSSL